MSHVDTLCCLCGERGPAATRALLADGRQLVLCRICSVRPAQLRAFVARFDAARRPHEPKVVFLDRVSRRDG
jgi:hypothetical protein